NEKGECKVHVEVGLIDPLEKIRDVAFHYIPSDALKSAAPTEGGLGALPGGHKIALKIEHQKAIGDFQLDAAQKSEMSVGFQAGYGRGDGKLVYTKVINHRLKIPAAENSAAKAADGENQTTGGGPQAVGTMPALARLLEKADTHAWQEKLNVAKISYDEK